MPGIAVSYGWQAPRVQIGPELLQSSYRTCCEHKQPVTQKDVEASARFYEERFGMRIIDRVDGNVYLRCWGDYYRYSLVITEGPEASLGRMAWRATSQAALEAAAQRVEATGVQGSWTAGGHGYGKSYEFTGPYGHPMRLFFDVEKFVAEPGFESTYPDRPERRSSHAAAPR